jgi:hypothetical protein
LETRRQKTGDWRLETGKQAEIISGENRLILNAPNFGRLSKGSVHCKLCFFHCSSVLKLDHFVNFHFERFFGGGTILIEQKSSLSLLKQ